MSLSTQVFFCFWTLVCDILYVHLHHPNREDLSVFEGGRVVQTVGKGSPLGWYIHTPMPVHCPEAVHVYTIQPQH